ncbi:MAG: PQQ-dependent sugar dehydrogenase [Planctomycetes bacterium]|nr:PQQ-dependent sugar dehydrogenase [Planctomycetota bacterium]
MKQPGRTRRVLTLVAACALGAVLGAGLMLRVLYNKPGKNMVWKIDRILERRAPDSPELVQAGAGAWQPAPATKVEASSVGYDYPVRIVFHPRPPQEEDDPFYYVAELGGAIKVVTKSGAVQTFAEGLLNFKRKPLDELGVLGLAHDPADNQFFVTMPYWDAEEAVYRNKIERLGCSPDGLTMTERAVVLDMQNESTVASYQIQFCAVGPEGLLYVGVGSGGHKQDAQDLDKFAGKIIRLNKDGTAAESNPFYQPSAPQAPRSYIYAYGLRNPFDITWDPRSHVGIISDVGPGIDRIVRLGPGMDYCFANDENQMRANALYTWGPGSGFAPVGVAYGLDESLGPEHLFRLFVGLFGAVHVPGPNEGKRICRFEIGPDGSLHSAARDFVQYTGSRFSSVTDVEWGPDGLYFADIYGESTEPHARGGIIYKIVKDENWVAPSDAAAALTGVARGRFLFYDNRCQSCHVLDGAGGQEGPVLTNLRASLSRRLLAPEYDAWLGELAAKSGRYFERHREAYKTLLSLGGTERLHYWFQQHVRDPRFDNPKAKMPSHDLSDADIAALAEFLLD